MNIFRRFSICAGKIGTGQFGDAFHQFCNGLTKDVFDFLMGSGGVLNAIVQKRTQNSIYIQTHFGDNFGNRQGMNDVGGTVFAFLFFMLVPGIVNSPVND